MQLEGVGAPGDRALHGAPRRILRAPAGYAPLPPAPRVETHHLGRVGGVAEATARGHEHGVLLGADGQCVRET